MNKRRPVGCCVNANVRLKPNFDRNEISFRVIKYYVNATQNRMPTHVHENFGSFWNTAEMNLHVNRTFLHAGVKSQTGMCSFRLSCERTLRITSLKRPLTEHLCWLSHIFWFLYWIYDTKILEIISEHLNRKSLKEERVL